MSCLTNRHGLIESQTLTLGISQDSSRPIDCQSLIGQSTLNFNFIYLFIYTISKRSLLGAFRNSALLSTGALFHDPLVI